MRILIFQILKLILLYTLLINIANNFKASAECSKVDNVCDNNINERYEPNWESLDKRPLPQWYDDAKIGIFLHFGVYTVPSYGSEWFWINWKSKVPDYTEFMRKNYKPSSTYQEFAKDFTTELFNATQWSMLFQESGAKYVVLTSKHHDGYTLWPSSRSFGWNSVDVGPTRDIIKELSSSIREHTSLKFGVYYSLFEWFNRMYINDKLRLFLTDDYVKSKMLVELKELVYLYFPEIIWSDGDWEAFPSYWTSTDFLAWLYNDSPVKETVVTNDRWGIGTSCKHGDFRTCSDRYNPGILQAHKWENALTLDKTSWGQRFDTNLENYMTTKELIKELVTTVSCGGNILINVGPTKYGTILPIFQERLLDLGKWLKINGEAIYSSQPWKHQNDTITEGVWFTKQQNSTNGLNVFAIVLNYPYDTNEIDLYAFDGKLSSKIEVSLLGMDNFKINYTAKKNILHIQFPPKNLSDKNGLNWAWTFKIKITN